MKVLIAGVFVDGEIRCVCGIDVSISKLFINPSSVNFNPFWIEYVLSGVSV